jgi:hypothetical protein
VVGVGPWLNAGVAAPSYVPNSLQQQPRRGLALPPARAWLQDRPSEVETAQPVGPQLGRPGPDLGYALRLVRQFEDRLVVTPPLSLTDVVEGCIGVAMARAALFGRAPVVHDLDIAFRVWGFLGEAPAELVEARRPLFESVAHHYNDQRAIVDRVPEATLRLSHGEIARRFPNDWRALLDLG